MNATELNNDNARLREVHLTDEQFAELLMGATPAAVQEHLKACTECAAEADRVAGAIGSFERESRLWAERRAAALPALVSAQRLSFGGASVFARPQAWASAALAVAIGVGVAVSVHRGRQPQQAVVAPPQPTMQAAAQAGAPGSSVQPSASVEARTARVTAMRLKQDNRLLSEIDGELRAEATPEGLYGLDVSSHVARAHTSGRMAN